MTKEEIKNQINEIADLLIEYGNTNAAIWDSTNSYMVCSEAALRNSSRTIGAISGKITALMIELGME